MTLSELRKLAERKYSKTVVMEHEMADGQTYLTCRLLSSQDNFLFIRDADPNVARTMLAGALSALPDWDKESK